MSGLKNEIKVAIIDDEKNEREFVRFLVEKYLPEIKDIYEAEDGIAGLEVIRSNKPDLIFLDIVMPKMNGFEMIKKLGMEGNLNSEVVIVTVHDDRAVEAYRLACLDFLLKPVDPEELKESFSRFKNKLEKDIKIRQLTERVEIAEYNLYSKEVPKMALYTRDGYIYINPQQDILYMQADGPCTYIHMVSGKIVYQTKTLKSYMELLEAYCFFRVHNTYLVNIRFVTGHKIESSLPKNDAEKTRSGMVATMQNGINIPVSRKRKMGFLRSLKECNATLS